MSRFVAGKSCLLCGGPIISRGPKRDAAAVYCSRQHRIDHHKAVYAAQGRGLLTKTCENPDCGKEFTYYASMRPQAAYCSLSCKSIMAGKKLVGRPPGTNSTRSTWNKSVRRFFYDRCSICGWDEAPCDVAHIEARKNGGKDSIENVTMLCPNHHRMYDCGLISRDEVRQARIKILRSSDPRSGPDAAHNT